MLFIHFVENAFKFGANYPDSPFILIRLASTSEQLYFKVQNHFETGDPQHLENGTSGIGLQNVTRRLNLLYPGQHQLVISRNREEHLYTVELTITLVA
jgi:two-component system, LytTR family, sensor kinase